MSQLYKFDPHKIFELITTVKKRENVSFNKRAQIRLVCDIKINVENFPAFHFWWHSRKRNTTLSIPVTLWYSIKNKKNFLCFFVIFKNVGRTQRSIRYLAGAHTPLSSEKNNCLKTDKKQIFPHHTMGFGTRLDVVLNSFGWRNFQSIEWYTHFTGRKYDCL